MNCSCYCRSVCAEDAFAFAARFFCFGLFCLLDGIWFGCDVCPPMSTDAHQGVSDAANIR